MISKWWWLPPLVFAVVLAGLWCSAANRELFLMFNSLSTYTGTTLWAAVTMFGDTVTIFTLALLLVGRRPVALWGMLLVALLATPIVHGIKAWSDVPRPPAVIDPGVLHVIGPAHMSLAFPSGHTTAVFILTALWCLLPDVRPWSKWALLCGAALVGVSRMAVGVHWPLDVVAGALCGWLCAVAGLWLALESRRALNPRVQRWVAALFGACALALLFSYDGGYPQARWVEMGTAALCLLLALPRLQALFHWKA